MNELEILGFDEVPSMESLIGDLTEKVEQYVPGSLVKGTVVDKIDSGVLIDIGFKAEGFVNKDEFAEEWETVEKGQEFQFFLEKIEDKNSMPVMSRLKAVEENAWKRITEKYKVDDVIKGFVKMRIKGGLIVDIDGIDSFLPGSLVDIGPVKNLDAFVENEYEFKIVGISDENKNIILSRKALLKDEKEEKKQKMIANIKVGDLCKGYVKNVTDFGAFVDIDGVDALLHVTDMSWGRISHPNEIVSNGQEIEVVIIKVDEEKNQIGLGLKQKTANPWEGLGERYEVGTKVIGKVVNIMNYGAFVELEEGVEGLIHVSEMSWLKRITRPNDVLSIGQEIETMILSVSTDKKKISLGLRQLTTNPWEAIEAEYPAGTKITGKIRNLTSYGAFIQVNDDIDGMIHCSDISWTRNISKPEEVFAKGQEVEAVVLGIDVKNQRVSLGIKQLSSDPWDNIEKLFKVGDKIKCTVTKLASYGAFVQLTDDIDGLIHITRLSNKKFEKVSEVVNIDDEVDAVVTKIDEEERRIGLSLREEDADIALATQGSKIGDMGHFFESALNGLEDMEEK